MVDPSAWSVADIGGRETFTYRLDTATAEDVREAAGRLTVERSAFHTIRREQVRLPLAGPVLDRLYGDLENGRGFAVLAGFPSERMSYEDSLRAFVAVGAHLGEVAIQNYEGESIVDVKDDGVPYSHTSRGYRSNKLLPFHTDGADLVGLMCLAPAAAGGDTVLVSATKVYQVIAEERPDVLRVLKRGYYHHRRGQHPPGENPLSDRRIPVFAIHEGLVHCCYNRNPMEWVEREGIRLAPEEVEALDVFDEVCGRAELQVCFRLEAGEILFFNNFVVLHSRSAFEDGRGRGRHMVRLWLQDPRSKRKGEGLLDVYVPGTSRYQTAT